MNRPTLASRRSPAPAVTLVVALVVLAVTVRSSVFSARGQARDDDAMRAVWAGDDAKDTLLSVLGYVSIGTAAAVLAGCVVIAVARHNVRLAVAAVVLVAGANLTTQLLKHVVLERPDHGLGTLNSLPSGHTTVVASVVMATMLVAPAQLRAVLGVLGGLVITLVATSMVVAGWHRPSDIVAGLCVSLAWTAAAAAFVRVRAYGMARYLVPAILGAAVAGVLVVVLGVRPLGGWSNVADAAAVLVGLGLASALAVASAGHLHPTRS